MNDATIQQRKQEIERKIVEVVAAHGCKLEEGYVDDTYVGVEVIAEVSSKPHLHTRIFNGKFRVYIGTYGNKQMFRQQKNGDFLYSVIALAIISIANSNERKMAEQIQAEQIRIQSLNVKKKLSDKYCMSEYSKQLKATGQGLDVILTGLTGQQADAILTAAKNVGVKLE